MYNIRKLVSKKRHTDEPDCEERGQEARGNARECRGAHLKTSIDLDKNDYVRATVLHDYDPSGSNFQTALSVNKGDAILVVPLEGGELWWPASMVSKRGHQRVGYVLHNYVELDRCVYGGNTNERAGGGGSKWMANPVAKSLATLGHLPSLPRRRSNQVAHSLEEGKASFDECHEIRPVSSSGLIDSETSTLTLLRCVSLSGACDADVRAAYIGADAAAYYGVDAASGATAEAADVRDDRALAIAAHVKSTAADSTIKAAVECASEAKAAMPSANARTPPQRITNSTAEQFEQFEKPTDDDAEISTMDSLLSSSVSFSFVSDDSCSFNDKEDGDTDCGVDVRGDDTAQQTGQGIETEDTDDDDAEDDDDWMAFYAQEEADETELALAAAQTPHIASKSEVDNRGLSLRLQHELREAAIFGERITLDLSFAGFVGIVLEIPVQRMLPPEVLGTWGLPLGVSILVKITVPTSGGAWYREVRGR